MAGPITNRQNTMTSMMMVTSPCLAAQVHGFLLVQVTEERILQVFNEADGLTGRFHFRTELLCSRSGIFQRRTPVPDGVSVQLLVEAEVFQLVRTQHHFGGNVQIGNLISLGDERRGTTGTRIRFDHIHLLILHCELMLMSPRMFSALGEFLCKFRTSGPAYSDSD